MFTHLFRQLIFSGVKQYQAEQYQSIRMSNILSLVASAMLILQLPMHLFFASAESFNQVVLILIHITLFSLIPQLNRANRYCTARLLLILIYSSYIGLTSFNYGFETPIHHFFLIAMFATPFLHFDLKPREILYMMLWFLLAFMFWESVLINHQLTTDKNLNTAIIAQSDILSFAISCFLVAYFIYTSLKASWYRIRKEQFKTEALLLNILPRQIAQRLDKQEKPIADYFENVTILFADIEGFSQLTRELPADELVNLLNQLFSRFDKLTRKFKLEKIKTIGDQYMAVSGVPLSYHRHALSSCQCAIRMQEEFILWTKEHQLNVGLRIGINSGPVVAGVIGIHKFSYDLWGESVNLASRMESQGAAGKIQVTEATYNEVKGELIFDYHDTIEVKGMGPQNVYWLREPYSV
ncbi:adenylate/guanylate cyclase domain-containing protein [Planctobacterium marinum]|uniref:adenylate/guanylate cyclase domain-containing protein n=1 Tax=Planctobacterium marinum TaxID=1631968 RepID=UPI0030C68159